MRARKQRWVTYSVGAYDAKGEQIGKRIAVTALTEGAARAQATILLQRMYATPIARVGMRKLAEVTVCI